MAIVKSFLVILIFVAQSLCFAQSNYEKDLFLSNIMGKDLKKQQDIIEKRVLVTLEKSMGLDLKTTLSYYFDPSIEFVDRDKFVDKILSSEKITEKNKIRFLESCDVFQCNLWAAENVNQDNFPVLKTSVYKLFTPENLKHMIDNKAKLKSVLEKLMVYVAKSNEEGDILFFSRYYGFYSIGLKYFKRNPSEITKSLWSHIDYCVLLLLAQKLDDANQCLKQRKEPVFKLHTLNLQSLSNKYGEVSRAEFDSVKKVILAFNDDDSNVLVTVLDLLLFKDASKIDFSQFSAETFGNNYFYGFMILQIMQKLETKPVLWLEKMKNVYNSKYRDSFLSNVLKGQEPADKIVSHFGPNALMSRAINFSK